MTAMQSTAPSEPPITKPSSLGAIAQRSRDLMHWLQRYSFSPAWLPSWAEHAWSGYVALLLVLGLVTSIGLFLNHFIPNFRMFGLLELTAIAFISIDWGMGPGLVTTILGAISFNMMELLPPFPPFHGWSHLLATFLFLVLGIVMSIGAYKVELARRHSNALAVSLAAQLLQEHKHALEEQAASKAREMALQEINHRMDEFLGMAAHELRTPLTVVKMGVQFTKQGLMQLASDETKVQQPSQYDLNIYHQFLEQAERKINVQERMINDLLDTVRLQTGQLVLQRTPTDLLRLVQQTVEDQRTLTPERHLSLLTASTQPLPVYIDRDRIQQVLTNFLTNALKYSAKEQVTVVQVEHLEQGARVSVIDQGEGIAPSEQEHIWDRFYRVAHHATKRPSNDGLGLGLHICRQIIELHGGHISVSSKVGEGSTFWFTLPYDRT